MKKRYLAYLFFGLFLLSGLFVAGSVMAFSLGPMPEGIGDLVVDGLTTIDLPPDGVLRYRNVTVNEGALLRFKRNAHNTPVTFLAYSSITINGGITVSAGININSGMEPSQEYYYFGGPGGYDGGKAGVGHSASGCMGYGPGGGDGGNAAPTVLDDLSFSGGGGFGTAGGNGSFLYEGQEFWSNGGRTYGNEYLNPLIGGSGGGGSRGYSQDGFDHPGRRGGGGGGAILIAATNTITVNGVIDAGGCSTFPDYNTPNLIGGGGSGGAIKLVATTINSEFGGIYAIGGWGQQTGQQLKAGDGGAGRIVLSCQYLNSPPYMSIPAATRTYPADTLNPENVAKLTISSVAGGSVPGNPHGAAANPDLIHAYTGPTLVPVVVNAENIPQGTEVTITATPQGLGNAGQGIGSGQLVGTNESSSVEIMTDIPPNVPTILIATATYSITALMGDIPVYAGGERVKSVKVSSQSGGKSKTTYITESGREVLARLY
jgi:hypothetical protein